MSDLLVAALDALSRQHLARALEDHRRWCRVNGIAFPPGLDQLARLAVTGGQERTDPLAEPVLAEAGPVAIALTFEEAGALLSVGERTVRRLVERGALRAVTIGGGSARRILRADLEHYAESLREPKAS
jgi:excisionase family DNA binding protein